MSFLKESDLLRTFKSYLLDIKPYHTKLDGIYAEYLFQDRFQVTIRETDPLLHVYMANVYGSDMFGGWRLYNTIESSAGTRRFLIPHVFIPRFSIDTFNDQYPIGKDPTREKDLNGPVNDVPYASTQLSRQGWSFSHQRGRTDEFPTPAKIIRKGFIITNINNTNGLLTYTFDLHFYYDTSNFYGADLSFPYVYSNGTLLNSGYTFDEPNNRIIFEDLQDFMQLTVDDDALILSMDGVDNDITYMPYAYDMINGDPDLSYIDGNLFVPFFQKKVQFKDYDINFHFDDSGAYRIPWHNGSYVTVDGVEQIFGEDYIVNNQRDMIHFLPGKHPTIDQDIRINYFNVDRLFIAYTQMFDVDVSDGYDNMLFDVPPYDSQIVGDNVLLTDFFTLTVDNNVPGGYTLTFFNSTYNSHKPILKDIKIYPGALEEAWTIKAIGPKTLSVTGLQSGPKGNAMYRARYDNGNIAFTVENQFLPYYMTPDTETYGTLNTNMLNVFGLNGSADTQDFLLNLNITSTHGIPDDFNVQLPSSYDEPVEINPFGKIVVANDGRHYFEFNDNPISGSVIEFRVEQNNQYNTWVQVDLDEKLVIDANDILIDYLDLVDFGFDLAPFDNEPFDGNITRDPDGTFDSEPNQLATAGVKEEFKLEVHYVDSGDDEIIRNDNMLASSYGQNYAINTLILIYDRDVLPTIEVTALNNPGSVLTPDSIDVDLIDLDDGTGTIIKQIVKIVIHFDTARTFDVYAS